MQQHTATGLKMTHAAAMQTGTSAIPTGADTVCRRGSTALLALRTQYGLQNIEIAAMDRITALRVAATFEFLRNNLPQETP
jgi:hypothetical protein